MPSLVDKKSKHTTEYPIGKIGKKNIYVNIECDNIDEADEKHEIKAKNIEPLPFLMNDKQRVSYYISAPSGAGKSWEAARLTKELLEMDKYKDNLPVLITQNEDADPAYEDIEMYKLNVEDEENFTQPNTFWSNTIMVFDDFDSGDPDIVDNIRSLLKIVLERGRKLNIAAIVCTHQTQNYNASRDVIFECSSYCLFPSANRNSVLKFAKAYLDMDKKQLDQFKKDMGSNRMITIHKAVPRYYITKNLIKLLD